MISFSRENKLRDLFIKARVFVKENRAIFGVATFIVVASISISVLALSSWATTSYTVNYQGRILESGQAIADGCHNMTFKIYEDTDSNGSGETLRLTDTRTCPAGVTTSNGLFSVLLDLSSATEIFDVNNDIYLEVTIEGQALTPMKKLALSPRAFYARTAGLLGTKAEGDFIFNDTAQQSGADFNIDGTAVVGTSLTTPSIATASGDLTITPFAGSDANFVLSTTGDFSVNTDQFYVDTSTGSVGVGTSTPGSRLDIKDGATQAYYEALKIRGGSGQPTAGVQLNLMSANALYTNWSHGQIRGEYDGGGGFSSKLTFFTNQDTTAASQTNMRASMTLLGNGSMGIGTTTPKSGINVHQRVFSMTDPAVAHGITTGIDLNGLDPTDTSMFLKLSRNSSTEGGALVMGFSDGTTAPGMYINGILGVTTPAVTTPAVVLAGSKKSGSGVAALGALETVLQVRNYSANLMTFLGSGYVGVGTASPTNPLTVGNDGTVTLPAISLGTTADSNTGIYHPAADTIAFSTNGTERFRIDNSGVSMTGDFLTATGTVWTSRTAAATNSWRSVAYGNGTFVAVSITGSGNRIMTSPDGINWTARTSPVDNSWNSVVYGNGVFVATAYSGDANRIMVSSDGVDWTAVAPPTGSWQRVVYGAGKFVAVSNSGGSSIINSPDGINWTAYTPPVTKSWIGLAYGNGMFVAVASDSAGNDIIYSSDGITWTQGTAPSGFGWQGVAYGNGLFVAVANNGIITSPNGVTWTSRTSPAANGWVSVTYGEGLFVAVALSGTNRVMTSSDGITWVTRSIAANVWIGVTYGNGIFVAVGSSGAVSTSGKMLQNNVPSGNVYQGGMKIVGDNVGIGTTTPGATLQINGGLCVTNGISACTDPGAGNIDVASGYKVGGTAGLSTSITVKGSDGNNCTLTVSGGIITATTCP